MSAARQTYPSIQLIVFDNDSPDGSRRIIEGLRQEYKFQFIRQEDLGLVKTLNRA
jgi:glycosyltransferase involved in cell wall biosynthesis